MRQDPLSGHLFCYFNRTADRVKILYWDRSGFCLWYKRLERGVFHLPRRGVAHFELEAAELLLLLDGIELARVTRRPRTRPVNTTPGDGADRSAEFREGEAASGAGCRAAGYASGAAWAAFQSRGSSSARRRLGWEGIRSSTSRRYAHGSRPCALHVATRL